MKTLNREPPQTTCNRPAEIKRQCQVVQFDPHGIGHCLYTEAIDLSALGTLEIVRASSIEFNNRAQQWEVKGVEGVLLFSDPSRQACLDWELQYFNR